MDPKNDTNLMKYLKKRIKKINKDYEITESEADGCDEDGIKYWVVCKNGYSSRSWDIPSEIHKRKLDIYENISTNGFEFKGTTYYYNHEQLKSLILKVK